MRSAIVASICQSTERPIMASPAMSRHASNHVKAKVSFVLLATTEGAVKERRETAGTTMTMRFELPGQRGRSSEGRQGLAG